MLNIRVYVLQFVLLLYYPGTWWFCAFNSVSIITSAVNSTGSLKIYRAEAVVQNSTWVEVEINLLK